jgi:hypothetical protein
VALLFQGDDLIPVNTTPEAKPKAVLAATHRFG